jgi:hypothetical protein
VKSAPDSIPLLVANSISFSFFIYPAAPLFKGFCCFFALFYCS